MNRKGQTLILFVILIPILILLLALVVDIGLVHTKRIEYRSIMEEGMRACLNQKDVESLKRVFELNQILENEYQVSYENDVEVLINKKISSIFGSIIGIEDYEMVLHYVGIQEKGEFVLKKIEKGRLA
ncbi:MAG: hypothetical protein IJ743_00035 [Bacilli bacterium]|nr:hypothetical protein [Bacilli bacterium]